MAEVAGGLENPILNSPYEAPERYFVLGPGRPDRRDQAWATTERVVHPCASHQEGAEAQGQGGG